MQFRKRAYTLNAVIDAGIPVSVAKTLLCDGPKAVPERPLVSLTGRTREKEPTTRYIWGPDASVLLQDRRTL